MRTVVVLVVVALGLAACADGERAGPDDDVLRRTVISFEVRSGGLLELDLTADPPTMQAGYGADAVTVEVADLGAAGELRARLLALPPDDPGCPRLRDPPFTARVATLPTAEDAPFADMAVHDTGGPCTELSDAEVAELVALWNRAGGALEFVPGG